MKKYISLGVVALSSLFFFSSNSASATSTSTTASVNVASSCSLSTSGGGYYSAVVPNGTFTEIEGSTFTVSCNDANGFALYAVGYTDYTVGNTNMIGDNSTNIVTNTSGNSSYWAMKVNPVTGNTPTIDNSFSSYHVIPTTHTKVASYSQSAPGGLSVKATYKVNISSTQSNGNYLGQVKYTLVHPTNEIVPHEVACTAGKICYNANTVTVEGTMGQQTPTSAQITNGIPLWASNFSRTGYGFAGWSDSYDYENDPDANLYGPNETITAPADVSTNGLSLYAVWIKSAGSLQNWDGCNSLASGATTALTDERDGNVYAVAKLADGKCWMIENLRLDDSAELSTTNTHNPSLPITNIYDATNPTTSNHLSATTDPTVTAWCTSNSAACDDQSMLATNNTTLFTSNTSSSYSTSSNVYSYGNYYNWYSATAGHGKYGSSYGSGYIAPGDICPAGWHLPTGNTTGEFYALNTALNSGATDSTASNGLRSYPNNFVYSGYVSGSSVNDRSSDGNYWSSSANSSSSAYSLGFGSSYVNPGTSSNFKYRGRMARCVAGV